MAKCQPFGLCIGELERARMSGGKTYIYVTEISGPDPAAEVALPQDMRIRLGHALLEHIARANGLSLLHIKGYAVDAGLYSDGRQSSDIDVLVDPMDIERLLGVLQTQGWNPVTGFKSGSLFHHAATLWHDSWGYVDVHRAFPGVGVEPTEFFDELWRSRSSRLIAGVDCTIPSSRHQALLIALHAGRDPERGASDVAQLREALPSEAWQRLRDDAVRFKAGLALAAATGGLSEYLEHPDHGVWAAVSTGSTRLQLLRARSRATGSVAGSIGVYASGLFPNRDHLRMALQRDPQFADFVKDIWERTGEFWNGLRSMRRG